MNINYDGKIYINIKQSFPFFSSLLFGCGFAALPLMTPIIFIDYFTNQCMFDKFVDNLNAEYNINITRRHQYNYEDIFDKYYSRPYLQIDIVKNK